MIYLIFCPFTVQSIMDSLYCYPFFRCCYILLTVNLEYHRGKKSKQINIAKHISKFLIHGAKMLEKCVKSHNFFLHCPFLQSQAK